MKPADCNSSKGVRRIEKNDADAEKFIKEALTLSRNGEAIIEEFLVGREIGADCMIVNHKAYVVMTRERRKINKNNTDAIQQIYGSFWPADLTEKNIQQIRVISEKIAKAFDIDNAPLMLQTILADEEFNIIEFGARIGGGDNYQIIEELTGYDIIQNSIRSFLGEPIEIFDLGERHKLMMDTYLYVNPPLDGSDKEQVFGCITYNDIARSNFEYEKCYRKKGDSIGYQISSNNRVGCFVVGGNTEQELLDKQAIVIANMEVFDMDGNPIMRKDIY